MPKPPLLAAATALQFLLQCGGGGSATTEPLLHTESYLGLAVDADNLFRWTPRSPNAAIELHLVLHNAASELPPGLAAYGVGPAEAETLVVNAVQAWLAAIPEPVELFVHADGGVPAPSSEVSSLDLSFVATDAAALSGYAWLETRFLAPRLVDGVFVQISVPDAPGEAARPMLDALVLHELGHAMGIIAPQPRTGHSPALTDVMHPEVYWTRLSVQDELAIRELYALEPNILRGDGESGAPQAPGAPTEPGDASADPTSSLLDSTTAWLGERLAPRRLRVSCAAPR